MLIKTSKTKLPRTSLKWHIHPKNRLVEKTSTNLFLGCSEDHKDAGVMIPGPILLNPKSV